MTRPSDWPAVLAALGAEEGGVMGLLDDMLRIKRELEASAPPPMFAVKCHPATGYRVAQMMREAMPDALGGWYERPPIYRDVNIAVGEVLIAQTRQMADMWRLQAHVEYWQRRRDEVTPLVATLRAVLAKRREDA